MSITVEDCQQGLTLIFDSGGRLLQAQAQRWQEVGPPQIAIPLINSSHALDAYSLMVSARFEGMPGWTGVLAYASCRGSLHNGLGQAVIVCEHRCSGEPALQVSPGFVAWPQRPNSALPVLRVHPSCPGLWIFSHLS